MTNTPKSGGQQNEGEGNRTYAKVYNDATTRFAQSEKVDPAAKKAEASLESAEASGLKKAEKAGRKPAHDAPEI